MKKIVKQVLMMLLLLLMSFPLWMGCGEGKPSGSVSGEVTYKGKLQRTGCLLFVNPKTGVGASGQLDASGSYHVLSLPAGEYQVAIQAPPLPSPDELSEGAKIEEIDIPEKYLDPQTSGLSATVVEGKNSIDFSL